MNVTRVSAILVAIFVLVSWWIIVTPASQILPEATNHAADIDFLFKFMLVASVAVFLIVQGFLLFFVIKYRHRDTDPPDALGADIHGNTRLEIVWSIIPAIFLVVLTAMSYNVYEEIIATHPNEYVITAVARQFSWECDHPKYKIKEFNTCHMPVNTRVRIDLDAVDVIHSFWVPEFRVKQDAVPGYPTHMHFTPIRVGDNYRLICSELCGVGHSEMYAKLYVCPTTAAEAAKSDACDHMTFDAWARNFGKQAAGGGSLANLSFSKDIQPIFQSRCVACHIANNLGGLHLTNYQGLVAGGNVVPGSIFKAGNHKASTLWQIVQPTPPWPGGNRMPLGGPYLDAPELNKIAAWIDQGAKNN